MRRLNQFWRKSAFIFLLSVLLLSHGISEKSYTITESELKEILNQTDKTMMKVNELTGSVKKLESQRNEYMTLSSELRLEAEAERKKKEFWRNATITISVSVIAGGVTYYLLNK
jgi:predicted Holliday junction resolvase-like endonuclease